MYYPMYFDPTYILVLIGVIICLVASAKRCRLSASIPEFDNHSGMTGREAGGRLFCTG